MSSVIYNVVIRCYSCVLFFVSKFNTKAKLWVDGRANYFDNLPVIANREIVWFHCASLGEFDMALPMMKKIKEQQPNVFILTSFFSPSGMEHYHKRNHSVDLAVYLPSDTPSNAKRFVEHFRPQTAFFVKYEFWPNFIREAKRCHVLLFSICTLLRKDQRFFKWYGSFFRQTLRHFDFFYVQNENTANLLKEIGIQNSLVIGDLRYDRVIENKQNLVKNQRIEDFLNGEKAIIVGSSWPSDEAIIFPFILKNPQLKFIIAPHNVNENTLTNIELALKGVTCRYTDNTTTKNILILNTIGHLSSAYYAGKIAYVGGGFSGKLHNILEPAVFGLPIIFGPKYDKFPEAVDFVQHGIGFSVKNESDFESVITSLDKKGAELSKKILDLVNENKGATDKILSHIIVNFKFNAD